MLDHRLTVLCLCLLAVPAWSQNEPPPPVAEGEKILVVGQRPGPGLWKVTKDDHVLWIFGTYSPLPKKMTWRSAQVEKIIAQSQEFLGSPSAGIGVGWANSFNIVTALPFVIGFKKNADGAHLKDVVPADVYARWTVLKAKYIGDDSGIESERPIFAAGALFDKALDKSALGSDREVQEQIKKISRQNKIKFTATGFSMQLENPRGALRDFKKSSLDDLACFTKTIDRLETDLEAMRVRANAWAVGDVEVMRKLTYPDQVEACNSAVFNSAWMIKTLPAAGAIEQRLRDSWVAAAEKALATNQSTFAVLPVAQILNPNGMVAALQAKGYQVEQPD
ncbi:TraB/GumN family protein [Massilia sp. R2A-15]|uniref:TraB/GumN family protein n=1 Tax=Massilia sp. R2A-15 TaxID=3064278 RepID=UPI00273758A3|nr:TraB/GumN family protein [Massilia sp. R2A-15]WLI89644.1 TraB/GumN family protein [Massilia sp. R2A-15]